MKGRFHLRALFALGAVVLLLAVAEVDTPLRPVLTTAFFAIGPGAAVVHRLHIRAGPLMDVSLAVAISVAVSMAVAQAMVWTGLFSPVAGVLAVLAVMAAASVRPERVSELTAEEVSR